MHGKVVLKVLMWRDFLKIMWYTAWGVILNKLCPKMLNVYRVIHLVMHV